MFIGLFEHDDDMFDEIQPVVTWHKYFRNFTRSLVSVFQALADRRWLVHHQVSRTRRAASPSFVVCHLVTHVFVAHSYAVLLAIAQLGRFRTPKATHLLFVLHATRAYGGTGPNKCQPVAFTRIVGCDVLWLSPTVLIVLIFRSPWLISDLKHYAALGRNSPRAVRWTPSRYACQRPPRLTRQCQQYGRDREFRHAGWWPTGMTRRIPRMRVAPFQPVRPQSFEGMTRATLPFLVLVK